MQSGDRQSNAQSEVTPGVMLLNDGCAHMPICTDGIVYIYTDISSYCTGVGLRISAKLNT